MTEAAADNPLDTLTEDRARARELDDPCANVCTLASVDAAGHPQARTVILRDLDGRLAIFGNATSPKWQQMQLSASLAVVVWLPSLQVQYRLQCDTRPVPKQQLHESWTLRPSPAKRLDWFYTRVQQQSSAIDSRDVLLDGLATLRVREPLVAPRTAEGVFLEPIFIERLDLSMPDGIHDRQAYRRVATGWRNFTLVP